MACRTSLVLVLLASGGCGSTRVTDTSRSASEEMLLSHAIDQAVGRLDVSVLAGQRIHLNTEHLGDIAFSDYLTTALRQHLLASGALLVPDPEQAAVLVEARAGAVSTTHHDTLVGIPETAVPAVLFGIGGTIPEVAIIKKTLHLGVAKVGVFAYRNDTGAGIWQSGMQQNQSVSRSKWFFGAGPFQSGDVILDGGGQLPPAATGRGARPKRVSTLELQQWIGGMPEPVEPEEEPEEQIEVIPPGEAEPDKRPLRLRPVTVSP